MLVFGKTKMNKLPILLMFLLFVRNVQCKAEYKIQFTRALVTIQNTDYVNGSLWISKVSRYVNGLNGFMDLLQDVPPEVKVTVKFYEFLHNEYRPFAINLQRDLCSFYELEYKSYFYPRLVKNGGHMPGPKCPIRKGFYTFANVTADETKMPPGLPFKKAMMEVGFWYQHKPLYVLQVYATFDRDAIIRDQYT